VGEAQRYRVVYKDDFAQVFDGMPLRDPDGEWVSADDHTARVAELERELADWRERDARTPWKHTVKRSRQEFEEEKTRIIHERDALAAANAELRAALEQIRDETLLGDPSRYYVQLQDAHATARAALAPSAREEAPDA